MDTDNPTPACDDCDFILGIIADIFSIGCSVRGNSLDDTIYDAAWDFSAGSGFLAIMMCVWPTLRGRTMGAGLSGGFIWFSICVLIGRSRIAGVI